MSSWQVRFFNFVLRNTFKRKPLAGGIPGERLDAPGACTAGQPEFEVAVIGSGFSGLGMAIRLKKAGVSSFVVLEKATVIGGTWRENTYPGCACDVPSHLYSFSWERNPDWSRMYASQWEIQAYLERCVEKYGLAPYLRFGAELQEALYDRAGDFWRLRTVDGRRFSARVLVSATGALHRPSYPALPGIERFSGAAFHSAQWRHDLDLAGKNIAVIGTGASAIQFVPQIAPAAARLTLYQRTPAWVLPRMDRPISARERWAFRHLPLAMRLFRDLLYWKQELRALGFLHPRMMKSAEKIAMRHLQRQIADPALRARLTPSYAMGCKRILIANDYFPALARPNVEVVADGIAEVRERSIVGRDGIERPADVIIYGTGFKVTDMLSTIRVVGRDGQELSAVWRDGPQAYLGLAAAGFPNLFLLLGPNTGLGHNSVVFMVEQQIRYVLRCLTCMKKKRAAAIEVLPQAQQRFMDRIRKELTTTVWASGCKSWYLDDKGRNVALWPGFSFAYWSRLKTMKLADFRLTRAREAGVPFSDRTDRSAPPA